MNIEFIKFYPQQKNKKTKSIVGMITIGLPEKKIKLQGITAIKKGNGPGKGVWKFRFPRSGCRDHETGEPAFYNFYSFDDKEEWDEIYRFVKDKAGEWIEKRLADEENPIIWKEWHIK